MAAVAISSSSALERLRRIAHRVATGVNLAGIAMVLDLQDANDRLRADLEGQQDNRTS
jgi:DNA-binding transcriptional MerR regulator